MLDAPRPIPLGVETAAATSPLPAVPATAHESLAADVAARLARVCVGWPPAAFAALVADVTHFKERWAPGNGAEPRTAASPSA